MKNHKRFITFVLTASFFILLSAGCAGSADWRYTNLPGGYELIRSSAKSINLAKADSQYEVLATNVVEGYISQFIVCGDYILVANEKDDSTTFYLVNSKDDSVQEFESEADLFDAASECGITVEQNWIKTSDIEHN